MSLVSQINRIKDARNSIRTKLNNLGIGTANDNLETCKNNIDNITNNINKTITGSFNNGAAGYVTCKNIAGYANNSTIVKTPITNLKAANIKSGVNVGGVVGSYSGNVSISTITVPIANLMKPLTIPNPLGKNVTGIIVYL